MPPEHRKPKKVPLREQLEAVAALREKRQQHGIDTLRAEAKRLGEMEKEQHSDFSGTNEHEVGGKSTNAPHHHSGTGTRTDESEPDDSYRKKVTVDVAPNYAMMLDLFNGSGSLLPDMNQDVTIPFELFEAVQNRQKHFRDEYCRVELELKDSKGRYSSCKSELEYSQERYKNVFATNQQLTARVEHLTNFSREVGLSRDAAERALQKANDEIFQLTETLRRREYDLASQERKAQELTEVVTTKNEALALLETQLADAKAHNEKLTGRMFLAAKSMRLKSSRASPYATPTQDPLSVPMPTVDEEGEDSLSLAGESQEGESYLKQALAKVYEEKQSALNALTSRLEHMECALMEYHDALSLESDKKDQLQAATRDNAIVSAVKVETDKINLGSVEFGECPFGQDSRFRSVWENLVEAVTAAHRSSHQTLRTFDRFETTLADSLSIRELTDRWKNFSTKWKSNCEASAKVASVNLVEMVSTVAEEEKRLVQAVRAEAEEKFRPPVIFKFAVSTQTEREAFSRRRGSVSVGISTMTATEVESENGSPMGASGSRTAYPAPPGLKNTKFYSNQSSQTIAVETSDRGVGPVDEAEAASSEGESRRSRGTRVSLLSHSATGGEKDQQRGRKQSVVSRVRRTDSLKSTSSVATTDDEIPATSSTKAGSSKRRATVGGKALLAAAQPTGRRKSSANVSPSEAKRKPSGESRRKKKPTTGAGPIGKDTIVVETDDDEATGSGEEEETQTANQSMEGKARGRKSTGAEQLEQADLGVNSMRHFPRSDSRKSSRDSAVRPLLHIPLDTDEEQQMGSPSSGGAPKGGGKRGKASKAPRSPKQQEGQRTSAASVREDTGTGIDEAPSTGTDNLSVTKSSPRGTGNKAVSPFDAGLQRGNRSLSASDFCDPSPRRSPGASMRLGGSFTGTTPIPPPPPPAVEKEIEVRIETKTEIVQVVPEWVNLLGIPPETLSNDVGALFTLLPEKFFEFHQLLMEFFNEVRRKVKATYPIADSAQYLLETASTTATSEERSIGDVYTVMKFDSEAIEALLAVLREGGQRTSTHASTKKLMAYKAKVDHLRLHQLDVKTGENLRGLSMMQRQELKAYRQTKVEAERLLAKAVPVTLAALERQEGTTSHQPDETLLADLHQYSGAATILRESPAPPLPRPLPHHPTKDPMIPEAQSDVSHRHAPHPPSTLPPLPRIHPESLTVSPTGTPSQLQPKPFAGDVSGGGVGVADGHLGAGGKWSAPPVQAPSTIHLALPKSLGYSSSLPQQTKRLIMGGGRNSGTRPHQELQQGSPRYPAIGMNPNQPFGGKPQAGPTGQPQTARVPRSVAPLDSGRSARGQPKPPPFGMHINPLRR